MFKMTRSLSGAAAVATIIMLVTSARAAANSSSDALRLRAAGELYNLDRERALATYREAIAADPDDAAAYRGVAASLWMGIAFQRGAMTVDSYLGRVSGDVRLPRPPRELALEFQRAIERATELSRRRLEVNRSDPDALYQLGAAVGLHASYTATVDGSVRAAFWSARQAYDAHERVLELDPRRHDAGLVVGTYRYLVAVMAFPVRWAAYVAGFGGGRERGLQLIEAAASHPGESETDARIALVLLYNRERRFGEALRELARLREQYPRNRLLWLESGSTALRAGRYGEAEAFLSDGLARLAADNRPRMFGEDAIWHYKRGLGRAAVGRDRGAEQDLRRALASDGRGWVRGRAHFELGKVALRAGNRPAAETEFRLAIGLAENDDDPMTAEAARRLLRQR
jgi:tetratricopeptide (TPR) repeat protein